MAKSNTPTRKPTTVDTAPANLSTTPLMAPPSGNATAPEAALTFTTRFGQVTVNPATQLTFPQGLFGFRECTQFGLAQVPGMEQTPLMLLQCLNQPGVAFLVANPDQLGLAYNAEDQIEALASTGFAAASTQFLTILTLYEAGESHHLTANLKAPVLVDAEQRTGQQFILSNKSLSTQHKL